MISSAARAKYEELRILDYTDFSTVAYVGVGAPFGEPARLVKVWNTSDVDVLISYNGITPHDYAPAGTGSVIDIASNKVGPVDLLEQPASDRVYIAVADGVAPTRGRFTVTMMYASSR